MKNFTNNLKKQVVHSFSVKVGKTKPKNAPWEDTNLNQGSAFGTQEWIRLYIVAFPGKKRDRKRNVIESTKRNEWKNKKEFFMVGVKRKAEF